MSRLENPYKAEGTALFDLSASDMIWRGDICVTGLVKARSTDCVDYGLNTKPITFCSRLLVWTERGGHDNRATTIRKQVPRENGNSR